MKFNGKQFSPGSIDYLLGMERREEWSQFSVEGKAGAFCADKVNLIKFMEQKMQGNRYLEIGTFDGLTLSIMADLYPDKEFHGIDKFIDGHNTAAGCLKHFIDNNEMKKNVHLYWGTSTEVIPLLDGLFDLVFIDGDHSYEWVKADIENILPFVRQKGGVISFHDYFMKGVKSAIHERFKLVNAPKSFGDIVYIRI